MPQSVQWKGAAAPFDDDGEVGLVLGVPTLGLLAPGARPVNRREGQATQSQPRQSTHLEAGIAAGRPGRLAGDQPRRLLLKVRAVSHFRASTRLLPASRSMDCPRTRSADTVAAQWARSAGADSCSRPVPVSACCTRQRRRRGECRPKAQPNRGIAPIGSIEIVVHLVGSLSMLEQKPGSRRGQSHRCQVERTCWGSCRHERGSAAARPIGRHAYGRDAAPRFEPRSRRPSVADQERP